MHFHLSFYYRFHDFLETNVGWLLFWNAKKLEFMFFLVQPVRNKNGMYCIYNKSSCSFIIIIKKITFIFITIKI